MIQRLLVPLAVRSFFLAIVVAGLTSVFLAPVHLLRGEQTMSATLREVSAGVSWTGSVVSGNAVFDQSGCEQSQTCDVFTLRVVIDDRYRALHPRFAVSIRLGWDDPRNDFDLYVTKDGRIVSNSIQCQTNSEEVRLNQPANGIYNVFVHTVSAELATTYDGRVRILPALPDSPQRVAQYQKDPDGKDGPRMFRFAPELALDQGGNGKGVRADIEIDPFGNTYVASDGSDLAVGDSQSVLGKLYIVGDRQWAATDGHRYMLHRAKVLVSSYGAPTMAAAPTNPCQ